MKFENVAVGDLIGHTTILSPVRLTEHYLIVSIENIKYSGQKCYYMYSLSLGRIVPNVLLPQYDYFEFSLVSKCPS